MRADWLVRLVVSAVVRRTSLCFLGALVAWCSVGKAHAQTCAIPQVYDTSPTVNGCTQSGALQLCQKHRDAYNATVGPSYPDSYRAECRLNDYGGGKGAYICKQNNNTAFCPTGPTYQQYGYYYVKADPSCTGKPNLPPGGYICQGGACLTSEATICQDGCQYKPAPLVDNRSATLRNWTYSGSWAPTGNTCPPDSSPPPKQPFDKEKPVCSPVTGTKSVYCTQPGQDCVFFGDGSSSCWAPNETGPKNNKDGTEAVSKGGPGETPRIPPINNPTQKDSFPSGDKTPDGKGGGLNTINGYTGTGRSEGTTGQSGPESNNGGTSQPSTNSNGTSTTTTTNTSGGDCKNGQGDCTNSGGAPAGVGDVPGGDSDATVSSEYAAFKSRIKNAPVIRAVTNFFQVSANGAACPVFVLPASRFWSSLTFDFHCSGPLAAALAAGGWLVLAGFAYVAIKVALG